jgi:phage terminase large subunit-like protein
VLEFCPDPPGWVSEIEEWEETYGEVVVRFDTNQPRRMGPACDDFEQAVRDGQLRHDGSEVIARHLANCVPITRGAHTWVQKDPNLPEDKIDAAVAAIVAHHRALYHRAHASEYVDFFVVDPNERPTG